MFCRTLGRAPNRAKSYKSYMSCSSYSLGLLSVACARVSVSATFAGLPRRSPQGEDGTNGHFSAPAISAPKTVNR